MTEAPYRGHKNDCGRNDSHWVIQKGLEDLSQDSPECSVDRLGTEDSTKGKPYNRILGGGCKTPSPPARDNALVVSIRIEDYNMHRVLVDNGSSADILYYLAF